MNSGFFHPQPAARSTPAKGRSTVLSLTLLSLLAPVISTAAGPVPLPPADLGQTNIMDGDGSPGALLELIGFGYGANQRNDARANAQPGSNEQQIESFIFHPIYASAHSWLGAYPGVEVLVPFSHVYNNFATSPSAGEAGLGDITVAPFLQWSKIAPQENVSVRLALQFVGPSGRYKYRDPVNTGQGVWQVSPYLAATWHVAPRWEVSERVIYDWSSAAAAASVYGPMASWQPGDFVVLNASASYALNANFQVGVGSYLLRQVRSAKAGGVAQPASLERVDAAGPVARWQVGRTTLFAAGFKEWDAANRPQGWSLNIRLQHPF